MPNNIVDVITYSSPIQTVADGDAANAANFALGIQGLANRTAFLNSILNTSGVTLLRSGNQAAMTALTGVTNGSVFFVTGQGLYVYVAAGAATVDGKFVITATGMGVGQWQHELLALLNTSLGFAALGPIAGFGGTTPGKLQTSTQTNCLISVNPLSSAITFNTSSASYTDITGYTLSIAGCLTGDILVCHLDSANLANASSAQLGLVANGTLIGETLVPSLSGSPIVVVGTRATYTVPSNGTMVVKAQLKQTAGGTAFMSNTITSKLLVEQYRP